MSKLIYEVRNHVGYVTFNRPEQRNAIDLEMRKELYLAMRDVKYNPDVWMAVFTGAGNDFTVGHDLKEMQLGVEWERQRWAEIAGDIQMDEISLYQYQREIMKPLVASVNGLALAQGAAIVLLSDLAVASDRAQLGWLQVKRGITSVSGPSILSTMLPWKHAMDCLLTGDFIPAQKCLQFGMVNSVVPHERLREETDGLVQRLLENAPLAMRAIKEASVWCQEIPKLTDRLRYAISMAEKVRNTTEDAKEGLLAFREKRPAVWKGR